MAKIRFHHFGFGTIFLFLLSISFLQCDLTESGKGDLRPLEGNLFVSVREGFPAYDTPPEIYLTLRTEKIYPCSNWSVRFKQRNVENLYYFTIEGIYSPDICLTALGPATASQKFSLQEGDYILNFIYQGITDQYRLQITRDRIRLQPSLTQFTASGDSLIWRYPPRSFAYVCGTTQETQWIYQDFLDTLLQVVPLQEFQFPDSGKVPYPVAPQGYYVNLPARYFYYQKESDYERAGEVLRDYSQRIIKNYSGVGIYLMNWRNKYFYSWQLAKSNQ